MAAQDNVALRRKALNEVALVAFRVIDGELAWFDKALREAGIESAFSVVRGDHGPELRIETDKKLMRVWLSIKAPGCHVSGTDVLGYVLARLDSEDTDRPIGLICFDGPSPQWRALLVGDLPPSGAVRYMPEATRHGVERLVELIRQQVVAAGYSRWGVIGEENGGAQIV